MQLKQNRKKVLLYLGKFPGYGFDVDGGSIMARQLIDLLKVHTILDVVFIRKNNETFEDPLVHSIRYVKYIDAFNNKFIRRGKNLDTNIAAVGDFSRYDIIITAHVSKFFGFESAPTSFWNKTILFPMFCTSSYQIAGETVPKWYTEMENIVINHVSKIITPSQAERCKLCEDYGCDPEKITIIPRGINPLFSPKDQHQFGTVLKIVYIGSVKPQKNNLDAVKLLKKLLDKGYKFELHLVCTIQDKIIYGNIIEYIKKNDITDYVFFHIGLQQSALASLLKQMDFNISVSNWETFGRGIFEGISSGLPTFVYNKLEVIRELCDGNPGVVFCSDLEDMSNQIEKLVISHEKYEVVRSTLPLIAEKVSYKTEQNRLLDTILK